MTRSTGASSASTGYIQFDETCKDVVGNPTGENILDIQKKTRRCVPLNGIYFDPSDPTKWTKCDNYTFLWMATSPPNPSSSGLPTLSSHVPQVVGASNPSRPYVGTDVFLGELREFPRMVSDILSRIRKPIAAAYRSGDRSERTYSKILRSSIRENFRQIDKVWLETQFGWLPFISDINKYLNVGSVIQKRVDEISRLSEFGSSSRSVKLLKVSSLSPPDARAISSALSRVFYAQEQTYQTITRWGSCKWHLIGDGPLSRNRDYDHIRRLAERSVLGLTVDSSTVWNLTPFSWLVDWAGNMGDYLESKRNIVGARPGLVSIMQHMEAGRIGTRTPGVDDKYIGINGGNFVISNEIKQRRIFSPYTLPEVTIPILSGRQSAILGALFSSRIRR